MSKDAIGTVLQAAYSLGDFFGCSLSQVSHINLSIAVYADMPDWLRGIKKERDLPRRVMALDLPHRVTAPAYESVKAQHIRWIVENLTGSWNFSQTYFFFETDTDAAKYLLVWTD